MQIRPRSSRPSAAATIALGTAMGASIWIAGASELAFTGYLMAAAVREAGTGPGCRMPRWPRSAT